jgi:3-oxoacyl-[acyl-carrier protein] reductase
LDLGLAGRKAIICGSSRGLGFACAKALVAEGARVVINGRSPEAVDAAARQLKAAFPGAAVDVCAADVATDSGRRELAETHPDADILVNNAAGPPPGDFRSWTREHWIAALDLNMISAIDMTRRVIDAMISRGFGRIINITSSAVKAPIGPLGLSNGARAGLTGFMSGLARDVAAKGVTINNMLPGSFDTDRLRAAHATIAAARGVDPAAFREGARMAIPMMRFGDPAEFGAVCAFLCSAQAAYITAQNVLLDGGAYPGSF